MFCTRALESVSTPAVVMDLTVVCNNLAAAARLACDGGVALRPHVKTHKSLRLAAMQCELGAVGVTAAKPSEAAMFLRAGMPSVTVAYPVLRANLIQKLLDAAADGGGEVRFVVDNQIGLETLADGARRPGRLLPAFMEIDVGLQRCGVNPDTQAAAALAAALDRAPGIHFLGLLSHAGQAYGAAGPVAVRAIAAQERALMASLADRLRRSGIQVEECSVGSTPTVFLNDGFDGLTEARPGNYVFMDLIQVTPGVARPQDVALQVLATVVSANASFAILDAGSKVLSSDRAPHGSETLQGHGLALPQDGGAPRQIVRLSEEHGFVRQDGRPLRAGERVCVIPNHACPVANLADRYLVADGAGVVEHWPVDARGTVQ